MHLGQIPQRGEWKLNNGTCCSATSKHIHINSGICSWLHHLWHLFPSPSSDPAHPSPFFRHVYFPLGSYKNPGPDQQSNWYISSLSCSSESTHLETLAGFLIERIGTCSWECGEKKSWLLHLHELSELNGMGPDTDWYACFVGNSKQLFFHHMNLLMPCMMNYILSHSRVFWRPGQEGFWRKFGGSSFQILCCGIIGQKRWMNKLCYHNSHVDDEVKSPLLCLMCTARLNNAQPMS